MQIDENFLGGRNFINAWHIPQSNRAFFASATIALFFMRLAGGRVERLRDARAERPCRVRHHFDRLRRPEATIEMGWRACAGPPCRRLRRPARVVFSGTDELRQSRNTRIRTCRPPMASGSRDRWLYEDRPATALMAVVMRRISLEGLSVFARRWNKESPRWFPSPMSMRRN
jgi:hypothetical protein